MDFHVKSSMGWGMTSDDEVDPNKVRCGLFALVTARLEDAHEFTVKGQSANVGNDRVTSLVSDIRSNRDEICIHLDAMVLIKNPQYLMPALSRKRSLNGGSNDCDTQPKQLIKITTY